ncbi:MAG: hypothetical protein AABX83_00425 [Nanoarchaeota archaeon]
MSEKVKCEICDRTFKDADGLSQHNAAKHASSDKHMHHKSKKSGKIIFILIIISILGFIIWSINGAITESNSCKTAPVTEINIGTHQDVKLHIHSELRIVIDGEEQFIPANIGVLPGIMRPVHTHDATGEIHMEGPCQRDFKVGEFFQVWGKEFSSQCIFDKCIDKGELKIIVNGIQNNEFENYIMRDDDNIVIEYKSTLPS